MSVLVLEKVRVKKKLDNKFTLLLNSVRRETFILYLLFFILSVVLISVFDKRSLHTMMNRYNCNFFDVFFKYATFLGDGVMFGVCTIIFFFVKKRLALVFTISGVLTLVLTYLLKKVMFKGMPRPAEFIGIENLHIVDGVKMAFWNTFPSGHTMTAFAIFSILCFYFGKCISQYVWVTFAIIAALSRVYLSQHFLIDVFVGSIIGVCIGFVSMALVFPAKSLKCNM